jgi:hypothetical protein
LRLTPAYRQSGGRFFLKHDKFLFQQHLGHDRDGDELENKSKDANSKNAPDTA